MKQSYLTSSPSESLTEQRVLITAGAGGIILAIAKAFVADGAPLHIADVNGDAVRQITSKQTGITGSAGDFSKAADLDTPFADVQRELGGLNVLVNNAGIAGATAPVAEYPEETWHAVVNVNLTGTFLVTQRAILLLKEFRPPRSS